MNIEQLLIQLGTAGAVIWAVVKLGTKFIDNWRATEGERTRELSAGMQSISNRIEAHHTADIQSHREMSEQLTRIETRQGTDTPARGVRIVRGDTNKGDR